VHADDAFAVAALSIIYPGAEVVRTRDTKAIKAVTGQPGVFLLDIGGVYNPQSRQFDHHQPEGAGFREPEYRRWPYATAGLVWKHYGSQAVLSLYPNLDGFNAQEVVNYIDAAILKYVDAVDCGIRLKNSGPSISSLVSSFNTPWFEPKNDPFMLVATLCQQILVNYTKRFVGKVLARDKVRLARLEMGGQLLILDSCVPWTEVVSEEMPEVKIVAYPAGARGESSNSWQLHTAMDADSRPRMLFPTHWAGKEFQILAESSGERGAIFCHRSRHLAGVNSYEGMLHMASIALKAADADNDYADDAQVEVDSSNPSEVKQPDLIELLQAQE